MLDLKKYFKRIGMEYEENIAPSNELLKKIQYNHMISVPYENLDLVDGVLLSLEPCDIYDKVVNKGRGGYCFELNGLLEYMLKKIGFECVSYLGRFIRGEEGIPMRRHRTVVVNIGNDRYMCDVGMGQESSRMPLHLVEGKVQESFGVSYKFRYDDQFGWVLCDLYKGEWRDYYSFTEEFQTNEDFYQPSFYWERHPTSKFNKFPIISLKTEKGRKTINDREFKVFEGKELTHIEENMTDERRKEVLCEEFGIKVVR